MSKIRKCETISFRLEKFSNFRVKLRKMETKNKTFGRIYRTFKLRTGRKGQGAWIIWRRKREKNGGRGRRESAKRQCAMKSSFIHTVSSNYQCIYSIPSRLPIVFKNNRAHT